MKILRPGSIRHVQILMWLCLATFACGRIDRAREKTIHDNLAETLPTAQNFDRWKDKWASRGFIVATRGSAFEKGADEGALRAQVLHSLLDSAGLETGSQTYATFGATLRSQIGLELLPVDLPAAGLQPAAESPDIDFAFVRVNDVTSIWKQLTANPVSVFRFLPDRDALKSAFSWQLDALHSVPDVLWAEPDLVSTLSDTRPRDRNLAGTWQAPAEFARRAPIVEMLKRIKADEAYKYSFENGQNPVEVNVAVLDTGVDSEHPDLKNQMFINRGETPGDGADNDGNCYADDVSGIDATIESCKKDESLAPVPGWADLGGPGKACPSADDADDPLKLSRNCGHGTHVAGIIAAQHGEDLNTLGVCPTCRIISLRVSERCLQPDSTVKDTCIKPTAPLKPGQYEVDSGISDLSQVRALTYLFKLRRPERKDTLMVNVVNMSLGKYFRSRAMSYLIRNMHERNVIVVAAAGNDNTDIPSYPAAYSTVVSVCATGTTLHRGPFAKANFSNFGDWVDICAPGVSIISTFPGKDIDGRSGNYESKDGTSQATPFVAGSIGYLLSVFGNSKSATELVRIVKAAANYKDLYNAEFNVNLYRACYSDNTACDHFLGSGLLDLDAALRSQAVSPAVETEAKAVQKGCVVQRSVIADPVERRLAFTTGLPFVLAQFLCALGVFRFLRRRRSST